MAELSDMAGAACRGRRAARGCATPDHGRLAHGRAARRRSVALCVNCLLCWLYCPDSAILLDGETFTGFDLDLCKGCAICAEVCPVGRDRDGAGMSDVRLLTGGEAVAHAMRQIDARRRPRLPDHAADADHPDLREVRRRRRGADRDRQRRVRALRDERRDRRRPRRSAAR